MLTIIRGAVLVIILAVETLSDSFAGAPDQDFIDSVQFSPDGSKIVTGLLENGVRVWDARTGQCLSWTGRSPGIVPSALFSPDGRSIVMIMDLNPPLLQFLDPATCAVIPPTIAQDWVVSAQFSPDGGRLLTSEIGSARVWDAKTGAPITPYMLHAENKGYVGARFSPDGKRVATCSDDKTAMIWDATTGLPLTKAMAHSDTVQYVAFSADGTRIVTIAGKSARVWDAFTGAPVTPVMEHADYIYQAEFSPDGSKIVTGSGDKTARIWDAKTGVPIAPSLPHADAVKFVHFSPDGTMVLTGSSDKTARLWDATTGVPLSPPLVQPESVGEALFSPDGRTFLVASLDKFVIYDTKSQAPLVNSAPFKSHA